MIPLNEPFESVDSSVSAGHKYGKLNVKQTGDVQKDRYGG